MACCPIHGETNPSFGVSLEPPHIANCFVCGGMSLEKVVAHCKGFYRKGGKGDLIYDFRRAKEWLQEKYNVSFKEVGGDRRSVPRYEEVYGPDSSEERGHPFSLPEFRIAKYGSGTSPLALLHARLYGFTGHTAKSFQFGFDRSLRRITLPVRWKDGTLAGVVGRTTQGEEEFLSVRRTIVIESADGRLRRIKFREILPNPKYRNYSAKDFDGEEDYEFDTSQIVFPLHKVTSGPRKSVRRLLPRFLRQKKFIIVCEGPLDAIALHQMGFTNAVSIFGSKISAEQLSIIIKFDVDYIVSMLDNAQTDEAGYAGMRRLVRLAKDKVPVLLVEYPKGKKDPRECDQHEVLRMVQQARIYLNKSVDRLT